MNNPKRTFTILLLLACTLLPATLQAATVRGRLDRVDGYGRRYAAPYVAVTLRAPNGARSAPSYTNAQGMYYLSNVRQGTWVLEVWTSRDPRQPPRTYTVVVRTEPYSDMAPIVVP